MKSTVTSPTNFFIFHHSNQTSTLLIIQTLVMKKPDQNNQI